MSVVLWMIAVAAAHPDGRRPAQGATGPFDCGLCHNRTGTFTELALPGTRPELAIVADQQPAAVGDLVTLTVTVTSAVDSTDRALGFAMRALGQDEDPFASHTGALDPLDARTKLNDKQPSDLVHAAPLPFLGAPVSFDVQLEILGEGAQQIYLVANDVDLDGTPDGDDYVWPQRFCFSVPPGAFASDSDCDAELQVSSDEPKAPSDTSDTGEPSVGTDSVDTGEPDGPVAPPAVAAPAGSCGCSSDSPGGVAWWSMLLIGLVGVLRRRG
ncbi:MAG: hypothetical protein KTR31_14605 [Myxococcales bacterium]|nr:hypothetical protein [Myxococcales bacterium]